jgi:hypothetical protein
MIRKLAMLLAGLLLLFVGACVTGPDGRSTLSPAARAFGERQLEHVLTCGVQAALSAAASAAAGGSGAPDYIRASECHVNLLREQLARDPSPNKTRRPSAERSREVNTTSPGRCSDAVHGQMVIGATALEQAGEHRQARKVAGQCDKLVRTCWLAAEDGG